jgi:hypothetical protein
MGYEIKRFPKTEISNSQLETRQASKRRIHLGMKGQLAIWVILGVVLVASVVLFFLLSPSADILKPAESEGVFDAQTFLEVCSTQYVNEVVDLMLPHGGFVNPSNTVYFNNTEIAYICFNRGSFEPCIVQHPLLINEVKLEIKDYITPRIDECFEEMKRSFEGRVGDVSYEPYLNVAVDLEEDKIVLNIDRETTIAKQEEIRRSDVFRIEVANPLYNLVTIAMEIADQESQFCYFEYIGFNVIYPRYEINPYVMSDPTTIYVIRDTKTGKEMNIATRGCAILPGGG